MSKQVPFSYDIVGSFLRPEYLKQARREYAQGNIGIKELKATEDKAIIELIIKQKQAGLSVITDGEFRRSWWHLDFMWGLNGVEKAELREGYRFHAEVTRGETVILKGRISGDSHPFVEHFKFVKALEDENVTARQTIPAPAQFLAELTRGENAEITWRYYENVEALIKDIASAYQTVLRELYAAGCRNVQLDDCTWGMFCDKKYWQNRQNKDENLSDLAKLYLKVNNLAVENKPEELVITTHVCRGNYHSTWAAQGGYAPIAPILFGEENVAAYYLEFDDERSGDFEPLKYVSGDKKVVLGLVTTKSAVLEKKEDIIRRIKEAKQYIPLERLCLSPQCGFASTEEGNQLTQEEQWAKLQLVQEIAKEIWK